MCDRTSLQFTGGSTNKLIPDRWTTSIGIAKDCLPSSRSDLDSHFTLSRSSHRPLSLPACRWNDACSRNKALVTASTHAQRLGVRASAAGLPQGPGRAISVNCSSKFSSTDWDLRSHLGLPLGRATLRHLACDVIQIKETLCIGVAAWIRQRRLHCGLQ